MRPSASGWVARCLQESDAWARGRRTLNSAPIVERMTMAKRDTTMLLLHQLPCYCYCSQNSSRVPCPSIHRGNNGLHHDGRVVASVSLGGGWSIGGGGGGSASIAVS
ncbi:hypothetical protein IG631_12448 [Alternaria alternata]|nr:hypothetical protein IG631_12448 [Alternaria alternata]